MPSKFEKKKPNGDQIQKGEKPVVLSADQTALIKKLQDAAGLIRTAMLTLRYDLQSIDVADLNSQFSTCLNPIKQFQPAKALRIRPSSLVQLMPGGGSAQVRISGGTPPYTIIPAWPTSVALKAEGPPDSGPAIVTITAESNVPHETYRLSVEDSAQNAVVIRIVVTAPTEQNNPGVEKAAAPGEGDKVKKAQESIRNALNTSATVRRSAWGKAGDNEWKADDPLANGNLRFYLTFKTSADASTAKHKAEKVMKLQTLGEKANAFAVNATGEDLEIIIPKAEIDALVTAISEQKWP